MIIIWLHLTQNPTHLPTNENESHDSSWRPFSQWDTYIASFDSKQPMRCQLTSHYSNLPISKHCQFTRYTDCKKGTCRFIKWCNASTQFPTIIQSCVKWDLQLRATDNGMQDVASSFSFNTTRVILDLSVQRTDSNTKYIQYTHRWPTSKCTGFTFSYLIYSGILYTNWNIPCNTWLNNVSIQKTPLYMIINFQFKRIKQIINSFYRISEHAVAVQALYSNVYQASIQVHWPT